MFPKRVWAMKSQTTVEVLSLERHDLFPLKLMLQAKCWAGAEKMGKNKTCSPICFPFDTLCENAKTKKGLFFLYLQT